MDMQELEKILNEHKQWLMKNSEGKCANLSFADLSSANLCGAALSSANLCGATLSSADLSSADLRRAYLSRAYLSLANLSGANLSGADLCGADLRGAYLSSANLSGAYLRRACLSSADLCGADLRGADLTSATLPRYAITPSQGSFIGWKKLSAGVIAKLEIPAEARRVTSLIGRKCRAEFVKVLEISGGNTEIRSLYDFDCVYRVGELVYPSSYDDDIRVECAKGIHFFITKEEAEAY